MALTFISDDLFKVPAAILINTVNCVGVMGKSLALSFKNKYPTMFLDYQKACKCGQVKPGQPHLWTDETTGTLIINFPTKVDWRNPSEYSYIEDGLLWLKNYLANKPDVTVNLPKLGCTCGGLDWPVVRDLIIKYLSDSPADIHVFGKPQAPNIEKMQIFVASDPSFTDVAFFNDRMDFYLSRCDKTSLVLIEQETIKQDSESMLTTYAKSRNITLTRFTYTYSGIDPTLLDQTQGLIVFTDGFYRPLTQLIETAKQKNITVKLPIPVKTVFHMALTGHRPNKLGGYNPSHPGYMQLQKHLEHLIEEQLAFYDIIIGHSGLALGADTTWSKAILAMKNKYPGRVLFHAEIPMLSQSSVWFKQADIDFWQHQVNTADFKTIYGDLSDYPDDQHKRMSSKLLDDRNKGMVGHTDRLIAVWDGSRGGTGNAVADAKRLGKNIVYIDRERDSRQLNYRASLSGSKLHQGGPDAHYCYQPELVTRILLLDSIIQLV